MGASLVYLDKPNTDIEFMAEESKTIKYVAGEMQGWRLNMVSVATHLDTHRIFKLNRDAEALQ